MRYTKSMQKVAAEILCRFMFTRNFDEMSEVWDGIFGDYGLKLDPFTKTPCTPDEYIKARREYEQQLMIEKYGHCDGLE